jgi:hypothetical protein
MTELRRNEFKDLLDMNEIIFIEHPHFIQSDITKIGNITYYPKSDKLQICKGNKWELEGYNFIKNHLKTVTENLYTEKDMMGFADYCRNGMLNTEYSIFRLKEHLEYWKTEINH